MKKLLFSIGLTFLVSSRSLFAAGACSDIAVDAAGLISKLHLAPDRVFVNVLSSPLVDRKLGTDVYRVALQLGTAATDDVIYDVELNRRTCQVVRVEMSK